MSAHTTPPVSPDLDGFRARAAAGRRIVSVSTRVVADDLTPLALYHRLCGSRAGTFLFESAEAGRWARYSFVGVRAAATLTTRNGVAAWDVPGRPIAGLPADADPIVVLRQTLELLATARELDAEGVPVLPPMSAAMVGYLAYDVVRRLENLPDCPPDDLNLPELAMMLVTDLAVFDHRVGEVILVANALNFDAADTGVDEAHADACARLDAMLAALRAPVEPLLAVSTDGEAPSVERRRTPEEFEQVVRDAVEEIRAGEAFQIVASQRFDLDCPADALDVYRVLRRTNPSPYLYLLRLDGFDVVGASPEALVTVNGGRAVTRPIAGTRPRGIDAAHDAALEAELLADEKERAEHLMLVDLGRNDLGRVCEPGTVEVVEFMKVSRYSHVMHLEAAVVGQLQAGRSALDATLSCFPAGTLSGAPKVRAMQIIDRLETSRRGLYGGVVGYFDFAGDSDVAIAIRTAVIKDGRAHVQAGAGIVADSVPANEDAETRNKAAAVVRAIQQASLLRRLDTTPAP